MMSAAAQTIYRALVDPAAVEKWRAPRGMTCRIESFDPRTGGTFRMALSYDTKDHAHPGKTTAEADVVEGRFVELVRDQRVVEQVDFVSDDPAFAGTMTISTVLTPRASGTEVSIICEDVPDGINAHDHLKGLASTLENLAAFTEK